MEVHNILENILPDSIDYLMLNTIYLSLPYPSKEECFNVILPKKYI